MPKLTRRDAKKIGDKLGAEYRSGGKHDIAIIKYGGKRIAHFGINRGRTGHGHIPGAIFVSLTFARRLADCPATLKDWVKVVRDKGIIE